MLSDPRTQIVGSGKTMAEDVAVPQPEGVSEVDVQIAQLQLVDLIAL